MVECQLSTPAMSGVLSYVSISRNPGDSTTITSGVMGVWNPTAILGGRNLLIACWDESDNQPCIKLAQYAWTGSTYQLVGEEPDRVTDYVPSWPRPSPRIIGGGLILCENADWRIAYWTRFDQNDWRMHIVNPTSTSDCFLPQAAIARIPSQGRENLVVSWTQQSDSRYYLMTRTVSLTSPAPILRINPGNPQAGRICTRTPMVVLHAEAMDGAGSEAESTQVTQQYCPPLTDSMSVVDSFGWAAYGRDQVWPLTRGPGEYHISAKFSFWTDSSFRETTCTVTDSCIYDPTAPVGEVRTSQEFSDCPVCTLAISANDPDDEPGTLMMRLANRRLGSVLQELNAGTWGFGVERKSLSLR